MSGECRGISGLAVKAELSAEAQGGRRGTSGGVGAASRTLVAADGCGTAPGRFWNARSGDLGGLLQLMVPAGAPLIRSAAMVAVIKAKVFGYLQVLLSPFLWLAGSV